MALERYEIIRPPASKLQQMVRQYTTAPGAPELPSITAVVRKIGMVASDHAEQIELDIKLIDIRPYENGDQLLGETGSNPVSIANIIISDAPDFPAVLTVAVPRIPGGMW